MVHAPCNGASACVQQSQKIITTPPFVTALVAEWPHPLILSQQKSFHALVLPEVAEQNFHGEFCLGVRFWTAEFGAAANRFWIPAEVCNNLIWSNVHLNRLVVGCPPTNIGTKILNASLILCLRCRFLCFVFHCVRNTSNALNSMKFLQMSVMNKCTSTLSANKVQKGQLTKCRNDNPPDLSHTEKTVVIVDSKSQSNCPVAAPPHTHHQN